MSKFKVGDKARRVFGDWQTHKVGSVSTITKIDDFGTDEDLYFEDGVFNACSDNYALVKEEPKRYFDGIKEGDRVWDILKGWGKVCRVDTEDVWGNICIEFPDGFSYYTLDGILEYTLYQSLFWDEIKFEIPNKPEPKLDWSKLPKDTLVLVGYTIDSVVTKRCLYEYPLCYSNGKSSWTTGINEECLNWKYFELGEDVTIDGITYPKGTRNF